MFETPKSLTYGHFVVVAGYRLSLGMVSGLLTLALVLEGYRLLRASVGGGGAWLSTSTVLWDLLLALAGGLSFPLLCQLIELSNQCAREFLFAFGSSSAGALGFTDLFSALRTITAPLAWIIFAVVALVVLLLLSLVRLVQIALLDVLLILLPVWALAWATPGLRPYGRLAATLLGELLLVQVLQDISLGMGAALIAGLGHATATPLSLLVGLAACYLAFRMPALLSRSVQAAQGSLPAVGEQLAVLLSLWL
ncbi:hypothetical protein [Thermogemmatispora sp.]|uniref:hypothetical protein n=1 Tax=Thermogemmatispora sp. TaxID=1968838 RepID=UPI0035E45B17